MNKTTGIVVGVVAVLALVVGLVAYNKTPAVQLGAQGQQGVQGPAGRDGKDGHDGVDGVTRVVTQVVEKPVQISAPIFGAMTGPDSPYNYSSVGGLTKYANRSALNYGSSGTTTPCYQISPTSTSTLVRTGLQVTTGTSTASLWTIATSTTAYATTTSLTTLTLGANLTGQVQYLGVAGSIFAPSTYIVFGVQGNAAGAQNYGAGTCFAEWVVF